ncbi:YkgJ family cysteine cluster protein [Desulfocurvibacter africanus]|uniref:YkgJ family cysteine cluster protein n=1 Tax=Desulfocurvibacter africanus TaxID=873 RepID=UPI00040F5FE4|nr:YkgJ family cysteine cluster protein [Desulfocurvibacter africanus]
MSESNLAFECRRCGHCCEGQGGIILTEQDVERLRTHLGLAREEFLTMAVEFKSDRNRLRTGPDGYCIYYRQDLHGCGIHPARPDICRAWPFFRGNLLDRLSWEMVQDYCPGVNPTVSHAEFVRQGQAYLRNCGLVAVGEDAPAALRPI